MPVLISKKNMPVRSDIMRMSFHMHDTISSLDGLSVIYVYVAFRQVYRFFTLWQQ
jgi:hypothetical protein